MSDEFTPDKLRDYWVRSGEFGRDDWACQFADVWEELEQKHTDLCELFSELRRELEKVEHERDVLWGSLHKIASYALAAAKRNDE